MKSRINIQLLHSCHLHWRCGHLSQPGTSNSVWLVAFVVPLRRNEFLHKGGLLSHPPLRWVFFPPLLTNLCGSFGSDHIHLSKWFRDLLNSKHFPSIIVSQKEEIKDGRVNPTPKLQGAAVGAAMTIFLSIFINFFSDTGQGFINTMGNTKMCFASAFYEDQLHFNEIDFVAVWLNEGIKHQWHRYSVSHCFIFCNIN